MISRSNIIWFSVFLFLVLVSAGFFFLRILPVMREASSLASQFESMLSQRRELVSRPEGPPSEALLRAAEEASAIKEEMLTDLEQKISIEVPRLLPEGIVRPSIYWLDTLRRKRPEISARARAAGLNIPSGLGFEDRLPSDGRVPILLFRLYVTEELIDKAAGSGLRSISVLSFGESSKAEGLGDFGVEKIPLGFSVRTSLENLFLFVQSLRDASFIYVIDDIKFEVVETERERPAARRPDPRARTREPEPDMYMTDVPERRIRERFLDVDLKVSMYYVPAGENDAVVPEPAPGDGEPDFMPEEKPDEEPDEIFDDPVERSRILR